MTAFQRVILIAMSLTLLGHMVSCWDQKSRDYILKLHNNIRRRPDSCEMMEMEWDLQLEGDAGAWAKQCKFQQPYNPGVGALLYADTSRLTEEKYLDTATKLWYSYIKYFKYGQKNCGAACGYEQLVWHSTKKVGCHAHLCPTLSNGQKNAYYLVCYYSPKGLVWGENPYKKSSQCSSKCAPGTKEDNGLCIDCKDKDRNCKFWAENGECEKNPYYMIKLRKCLNSCKQC